MALLRAHRPSPAFSESVRLTNLSSQDAASFSWESRQTLWNPVENGRISERCMEEWHCVDFMQRSLWKGEKGAKMFQDLVSLRRLLARAAAKASQVLMRLCPRASAVLMRLCPQTSAYLETLQRKATPGSLQASIAKYSSFNCITGTDKDTLHSYGPFYERLFAPYRDKATRVLEIGVYSGASIVVWAEYFKNAIVDGVDITSKTWRHDLFPLNDPRIRLHELDGALMTAPAELVKRGAPEMFDVIVEDGSHAVVHQIAHLAAFASSIAPGGIYVIEDIMQGEGTLKLKQAFTELSAKHGLRMEWHDLRENKWRADDIVAVFYKDA